MPAYLLDTNHVGLAVDRNSVVGQRTFEARQRKLTILTTDGDFDALPDIRTADWSQP